MTELVTRTECTLTADPRRVVARLFIPGQELVMDRQSRAASVIDRVLALSEEKVRATFSELAASYTSRHRDLPGILAAHYEQIVHLVPEADSLSDDRRALIGAVFTNEYSIEGAALFNPSVVEHPDQSGLGEGQRRFVLSLRAVGEGHLSSIEFRTGTIGPGPTLSLDEASPHVEIGTIEPTSYDRELFAAKLEDEGGSAESIAYFLHTVPATFDEGQLEHALATLNRRRITRQGGPRTDNLARRIANCSYEATFSPRTSISERVLWPEAPSETHGLEDARFVRFVEEDGTARYRATYTAFDGAGITPQVIDTVDFARFRISQLAGPAARDKGLALFPRQVGGRYLALTRSDRETCGISSSADGHWWAEPVHLHGPSQPWEVIQTGNCGSPIETEAGWVMLTHGVGPMREYAIGALLLDLHRPELVIGSLAEPLLRPAADERDGYVPNVVYSCGALRHGDNLLLPYGASDDSVRFAFIDLPLLVERLTAGG